MLATWGGAPIVAARASRVGLATAHPPWPPAAAAPPGGAALAIVAFVAPLAALASLAFDPTSAPTAHDPLLLILSLLLMPLLLMPPLMITPALDSFLRIHSKRFYVSNFDATGKYAM